MEKPRFPRHPTRGSRGLASAILTAALGVLLAAPSEGQAQVAFMDPSVQRQMQAAHELFLAGGFVREGDFLSGMIAQQTSQGIPVQLQGGRTYVILASCDDDCNDLDLELENRAGALVATDYEVDANPMLFLDRSVGGDYTLHVIMHHCALAPCSYAVGIYHQGP